MTRKPTCGRAPTIAQDDKAFEVQRRPACIVSLLYVMEADAAEIPVVGNEGILGVALFMGGESTPSRAVVQSAGRAYRLIGQCLKDDFHRSSELHHLVLRYTQALMTQMAQTAVCNRHHSIDQQSARQDHEPLGLVHRSLDAEPEFLTVA